MKKFFKELKSEVFTVAALVLWIFWASRSILGLEASTSNYEEDIKEVKADVKTIMNHLITK